jgi:putative ABC transport system permease protein
MESFQPNGILTERSQTSASRFRHSPGFTIAAVATLALGIGANTAVFSVVNTVLLRPARFADPERTVGLATSMPTGPDYFSSDPKFNLWRQQTNVFEDVTGQAYAKLNLTGVDSPEQVQAASVTSAYFRLLGLPIVHGGGFTPDEDQPNGRQVVVLSESHWILKVLRLALPLALYASGQIWRWRRNLMTCWRRLT